ncbi:hypothetical protein CHS0354_037124 [Potamilus streckersoni]|uniref:Uncharacterized protein n=1 Tax=Potamilus streckersoni TaxID=2493646 RepID=A0AAE0VGI1_9BIVA|nr:hypothetical protein CHS0354_037124 [Potamilus streckersoni]
MTPMVAMIFMASNVKRCNTTEVICTKPGARALYRSPPEIHIKGLIRGRRGTSFTPTLPKVSCRTAMPRLRIAVPVGFDNIEGQNDANIQC